MQVPRRTVIAGLTVLGTTAALGATGCAGTPAQPGPSGTTAGSDPPGSPSPTATPPVPVTHTATEVLGGLAVPRAIDRLQDGRILVWDQTGLVHVTDAGWRKRTQPLLDVRSLVTEPSRSLPELGLSGFAPAPDFTRTGVCFTLTTEEPQGKEDGRRVDRLRRWQADPRTLTARGTSSVVLSIPYDTLDHAGGGLAFDGDGNLFLGVGASTGDERALDPNSLVGTILRIRPTAEGYEVPSDNPFARGGGRKEVFSLGYRNPFRLAWDARLGLLVSEPMWNEKNQQVSVAVAGSNAGYPSVTRGTTCWVDGAVAEHCRTDSTGRPITPPVLEYGRTIGSIVSGAVAVRGAAAGLDGSVVVADWSGPLLVATPTTAAPWAWRQLGVAQGAVDGRLWAVDTDADGEVYLMMTDSLMSEGRVLRLTRS